MNTICEHGTKLYKFERMHGRQLCVIKYEAILMTMITMRHERRTRHRHRMRMSYYSSISSQHRPRIRRLLRGRLSENSEMHALRMAACGHQRFCEFCNDGTSAVTHVHMLSIGRVVGLWVMGPRGKLTLRSAAWRVCYTSQCRIVS